MSEHGLAQVFPVVWYKALGFILPFSTDQNRLLHLQPALDFSVKILPSNSLNIQAKLPVIKYSKLTYHKEYHCPNPKMVRIS